MMLRQLGSVSANLQSRTFAIKIWVDLQTCLLMNSDAWLLNSLETEHVDKDASQSYGLTL